MNIAILGYGTVGKSACEIINSCPQHKLCKVLVRAGKAVEPFMTSSITDITTSKEIETVAECIGGTTDAYDYVKACLEAKKNIVTANKALVAKYGLELNAIARKNNVSFIFSAACGGSSPVLSNICVSKRTDKISSCMGILNGTTNFILSGLKSGKFKNYAQALEQAQALGYAEADPTADISGMDAFRKVQLLSAVSFDVLPEVNDCLEGIVNIDLNTMRDSTVKLIGFCGLNSDKTVYAFVEPMICKRASWFSSIDKNNNLIIYNGIATSSLAGQGAGGKPTASNVLRDITYVSMGFKYFLDDCCHSEKANNSEILHRYLICTEEKTWRTEKISVQQMHDDARKMREQGIKVFFASIEE